MCVYVCLCVCVCVCLQREAYERNLVLPARVATWTAAVIWGSLAESVCVRVGLAVVPESGAYTVAAYVDLLTFQEELPHYIALKTKHMFTLDAATPQAPFGNEKGRS
jgi:hypothetical protein